MPIAEWSKARERHARPLAYAKIPASPQMCGMGRKVITFAPTEYHSYLHHFYCNRADRPAMASMIMASSKTFVNTIPTPRLTPLPKIPLPTFPKPHQLPTSLKSVPSLLAAAASFTLANAAPSLAEEMQKAQLFDFNLTLPIIAVQFLILMFALDKVYYTPLGKFMDDRDAAIREKLGSVKDTSAEVKALEDQAAAVMKAARAEISAALNKMKKETQLEVEQKLAEKRNKVELELQEALATLEKQKDDTIKSLDSQIATLSDEIVKKVLPVSYPKK